MTSSIRTAATAGIVLLGLALAGCASAAPEPAASDSPAAEACEVSIVVDFGVLDEPSVEACGSAGGAADVLAEGGVATEGTVDYGDQVVCRVNGLPSAEDPVTIEGQEPFTESCQTFNSVAYWALWVKTAPDAEWEYAQEGVSTLQLADGQSLGLVYTAGTDSIPPQG